MDKESQFKKPRQYSMINSHVSQDPCQKVRAPSVICFRRSALRALSFVPLLRSVSIVPCRSLADSNVSCAAATLVSVVYNIYEAPCSCRTFAFAPQIVLRTLTNPKPTFFSLFYLDTSQ